MNDKFKKIAKMISENKDLQEKIKSFGEDENAIKSFIIEESKKNGITLTDDDFNQTTDELSKEEMAAICGAGGCGCFIGGGGGGDGLKCVCVKAGTGKVEGRGGISSQGGCVCVVAGAGATRRH